MKLAVHRPQKQAGLRVERRLGEVSAHRPQRLAAHVERRSSGPGRHQEGPLPEIGNGTHRRWNRERSKRLGGRRQRMHRELRGLRRRWRLAGGERRSAVRCNEPAHATRYRTTQRARPSVVNQDRVIGGNHERVVPCPLEELQLARRLRKERTSHDDASVDVVERHSSPLRHEQRQQQTIGRKRIGRRHRSTRLHRHSRTVRHECATRRWRWARFCDHRLQPRRRRGRRRRRRAAGTEQSDREQGNSHGRGLYMRRPR